MSEQPNQSAQPPRSPSGGPKLRKDLFPPKLSWWEKATLWISYTALILMSLYLMDQLCLQRITASSVCGTYIAFGVVLSMLLIDRLVRHRLFVHKARLEDPSEIEALIVEAKTVERRLTDPEKPHNYDEKKDQLEKEVTRLQEEVSNRGWTEYQVLSLNQMLVDFLKVDDLIARAQLNLAELEEYAEDSAYRYDRDQYYSWQKRIEEIIEEIDKATEQKDGDTAKSDEFAEHSVDCQSAKDVARDNVAEPLRAALRTLLDHVASYRASWSEGSAIVRGLLTCGVVAIPLLLAMGLLPRLHPGGDQTLGILNWGILGIIGSIAAVLRDVRMSDPIEIGNTAGKKELWRAVVGAALALLAGVLTYATISGGLLSGHAVPKVDDTSLPNISLSIIWAVGAGFSFERVFGRMLSVTEAGTR